MKRPFLTVLLSLLSVFFLNAQVTLDYEVPKTYTIGGMTVEGCEFTTQNSVILHTGLAIGDDITIPGSEVSKAIKSLWEQKVFADIDIVVDNIVDDKIFLLIRVEERPRISSFSFKGINKSQADDLREKLRFIRSSMWTPEKERRARRIIKNYFMEKSYYSTRVNFNTVDDELLKSGVKIKILVDRGERIKIHEIKIEGNQDFSDKRLKSKMKALKEKKGWRLWARSKY
ncbi:MAG TPA: outer membrane protein assembly factor BamA, partial [Bacteroidetes bacterium]|nr:outer membrane protein assembly factor BamA [Bacteroidota bacterium]